MNVMRLWLLVLLSSAMPTTMARRGGGGGVKVPTSSPNAVPPFHPPRQHCLDPWGYPYGWGLDDNCFPADDPAQQDMTQMKEVKRVTPSKQMVPPQKKTGWFGVKPDPTHPHWKDVDEVMDGLE